MDLLRYPLPTDQGHWRKPEDQPDEGAGGDRIGEPVNGLHRLTIPYKQPHIGIAYVEMALEALEGVIRSDEENS